MEQLITVLSPHRDDASFSLGLALSQWSAASVKLRVLNFFTRSAYAPHSSAQTVEEISAVRKKEDQSALNFIGSGIEVRALDLLEAPLRLPISLGEITQPQSAEKISSEEVRELAQSIGQHCIGSLVVAPLALGNHVDHVAVRRAALHASPPERLAFYEDLPYATWTSLDDLQARIASVQSEMGVPLKPFLLQIPDAVTRKRFIASFYRSQITDEEADAIAQFARSYGNGERIWLPVGSFGWNAIRRLATKLPQMAIPGPPRQQPE